MARVAFDFNRCRRGKLEDLGRGTGGELLGSKRSLPGEDESPAAAVGGPVARGGRPDREKEPLNLMRRRDCGLAVPVDIDGAKIQRVLPEHERLVRQPGRGQG